MDEPLARIHPRHLGGGQMTSSQQAVHHYSCFCNTVVVQSAWDTLQHLAIFCAMAIGYKHYLDFFLPRVKKNKKSGEHCAAEEDEPRWDCGTVASSVHNFSRAQCNRLREVQIRFEKAYLDANVSISHDSAEPWPFQTFAQHVFFARKGFSAAIRTHCRVWKSFVVTESELLLTCQALFSGSGSYLDFFTKVQNSEKKNERERRKAMRKLKKGPKTRQSPGAWDDGTLDAMPTLRPVKPVDYVALADEGEKSKQPTNDEYLEGVLFKGKHGCEEKLPQEDDYVVGFSKKKGLEREAEAWWTNTPKLQI